MTESFIALMREQARKSRALVRASRGEKKLTLDELQKLCDEATPEPWGNHIFQYDDKHYAITPDVRTQDQAGSDAMFIAAARKYTPLLIAVARAADPTTKGHSFERKANEYYSIPADQIHELIKALAKLRDANE